MSQRSFRTLFVVVCVAALLPLIFPLFEVANSGTPIVAGLPFGFFWLVAWVLIIAACMVVLYRVDPDNRNSEED